MGICWLSVVCSFVQLVGWYWLWGYPVAGIELSGLIEYFQDEVYEGGTL